MRELVLNIHQFYITVPPIRKEEFVAKDAVINTRKAKNIRNGQGKEK